MVGRLSPLRGRGLAIVGFLSILLLLATSAAAGRQQAASITLIPSSGPAGSTVTVQGTGWSATVGEIHWDDSAYTLIGTFQANANGAFSTTITIPSGATAGQHIVQACQFCRSIVRAPILASAQFNVTGQVQRPTEVIILPTPPRPTTACDPRGVAGEVVIDFEDFPLGTRLDGTTLPERVTFLGEDALVVFDPAVNTMSPSRALMNDFAGREFGSINIPIRFRLEGAADFVGVFVGLNEQIWADEPITATLTAFGFGADGHRVEVGSDSKMFGPGPTPIQVCLGVEAPGQILEVTISYTATGGVAEPEVIDDLIVRGPVTPVPTPIDDLPPVVTIETPEDGAFITDPYPRLQGQVSEDRELSRLELWLNGSLYREIGASPAGYAPSGDRLYLFALDPIPVSGILACGENTVEVRAYDTSFNRGSDVASVELLVGDLTIVSAEPVQALYGAPLVRGKGTAFRVRVSSTYGCEVQASIRLELPPEQWTTTPPQTGLTGAGIPSDYEYPDVWTARIPANAAEFAIMLPLVPEGEETLAYDTTNPEGLVEGGDLRGLYGPDVRNVPRPNSDSASFAVEIDPDRSLTETNETNNRLSVGDQPVFNTRPVRLVFVPWLFELDPGSEESESDYEFYLRESGYSDVAERMDAARDALDQGRVPLNVALSSEDIARLEREARRYVGFFLGAFPIADSEISFRLYDYMYFQAEYLSAHGFNRCNDWEWRDDTNDLMFSAYPDADVVILLRVMGCCGQSPGVFVDAGLELVGSPPDWHHVIGNEDLSPGDPDYICWDWSYPLQGAAEYVIGHELNHWLMDFGGECYDCRNPAHMGVDCAYCTLDAEGFWVNRWMSFDAGSPYFSHAICDGCIYWNRLEPSVDKYGNPNPDGYRNAIGALAPIPDPDVLLVRGDVERGREVTLDPFMVLPDGLPDLAPGTVGDYSIVLLGESGQILDAFGFDVSFTVYGPPPSLPEEAGRAHFVHRVEWREGVRRIEIRDAQGTVVAGRDVTSGAPQVRLLEPNGGENWRAGREVTIRWEASDPDGDDLSYAVALSYDGGESWIPVDIDLTETEYSFHTGGLLEGSHYLIRVTATDGVNTSADVSDAAFSIRQAFALPLPVWTLAAIGILVVVGVGLIGYGAFSALRGTRRR